MKPCAPTILGRPPSGPGWFHEIKHDGYRIIARKDGDRVRLWTRQQNECASRFRRIAAAVAALPVESCTLDAEAVVFRSDGHCDFHVLRSSSGAERASLVCFDLLELCGEDLRRLPIGPRRAKLAGLLANRALHSPLIFSETFDQDGAEVFAHAQGIVSKRRASTHVAATEVSQRVPEGTAASRSQHPDGSRRREHRSEPLAPAERRGGNEGSA